MSENKEDIQLDGGTYELLQKRLVGAGQDLAGRVAQLNEARKSVFGNVETALISTDKITTEHNCVPRDMIPVGNGNFLFGYNVHMGLKTTTAVADVLALYTYDNAEHVFHKAEASFLSDEKFLADFENLYKYYRNTTFTKFAEIGPFVYMVFQIGKSITDVKTFKWKLADGELLYVDNRSEHEFVFPDQHGFRWKRTNRDSHRSGEHPHISIEDRVFVETVGGDLTVKVEDNTDTGLGIYAEPVDQPDQTLDDADVYYALVGNLIFLKIRPYKEEDYRYIIYNEKIQEAIRVDALEDSCVLLPEDQGVIFAKGYYIQSGEFKLFENQLEDMLYERRVGAPNGEDFLYIFYNKVSGMYILLSYNLIEQTVKTPIICHGFSIFENGELCFFKGDEEQKKHHTIQVWQTPYHHPDLQQDTSNDSYLYRLGNKEVVRGMAECNSILKLINKDDTYEGLYVDIVKSAADVVDTYHWLGREEAQNLLEPLNAIKMAASSAIEAFEKVKRVKQQTRTRVQEILGKADAFLPKVKHVEVKTINQFVDHLYELRLLRGEIISLKELRYVDHEKVDAYEDKMKQTLEDLSEACVQFLLKDEALDPYRNRVLELEAEIEQLVKSVEAQQVEEEVMELSKKLEMLIEIVGGLKIQDPTETARIIDNITAIYAQFNQLNAGLKRHRKALLEAEGEAQFNAQIKLVAQGIVNYLDVSDTPEKCEDNLNKLMVQLEELEAKFSDFDAYLEKVAEKREEVYNAFESKKIALVEARSKRASTLQASADRILKGIGNRLKQFKSTAEINAYFVSDPMIDKVRDIIEQLMALNDTVKADDLQSRLKSVQEDGIRQLRDKQDLFQGDDNAIQLGKHRFLVNTKPLDLTMVLRDESLFYHLTGTNFYEEVETAQFEPYKSYWNQTLISESSTVYRGEYLAYLFCSHYKEQGKLSALQQSTSDELMDLLHNFMNNRYNDGYAKGVHDVDALQLIQVYVKCAVNLGLLSYPGTARSAANLFWNVLLDEPERQSWKNRIEALAPFAKAFPEKGQFDLLLSDLKESMSGSFESWGEDFADVALAAEYLYEVVLQHAGFQIHEDAQDLHTAFESYLSKRKIKGVFAETLQNDSVSVRQKVELIEAWLTAFLADSDRVFNAHAIHELTALYVVGNYKKESVVKIQDKLPLEDFKGDHGVIDQGAYSFDFIAFEQKLRAYVHVDVPAFKDYHDMKNRLLHEFKEELKLHEFKPRVMSSFVRNKLINEVYLPVIGDNLAKQIGSAGEKKRTDLMGMLLLVSPPGYGKTTLMEYMASRLGLVFVKINGPAIGHEVTAVDPASASNSAAREELEKLNLAFEMGDNVMLYLDDIQHCNPEFLQKFISLCDGQRKIEGVYKGKSKTYDFRGKKMAVIMAGNPYTESGDKFQIPDMLANRADIYNLGDMSGSNAEAFEMSYVENAMTSNPITETLMRKSQRDLYAMIKLIEHGDQETVNFEMDHSAEEIQEYSQVLSKMLKVRDVILKVNAQYIYSAAQEDAYRTEPAFKLQGSYRDMNKMVEKLLAEMNAEELQGLIDQHYENESQTLTSGAEANLLKFKEMTTGLDDEELARWSTIKETFAKNNKAKGLGDQAQMVELLDQVARLNEGLMGITRALEK